MSDELKRYIPRLLQDDAMIEVAALAARVRVLEAQVEAKDSALEFAKGAISDAIYLEDGLDGATGQTVQRIIVEALEHGTFDKTVCDFMTTDERKLEQQLATARAAVMELAEMVFKFACPHPGHGDNADYQRAVALRAQAQGTDTPTQGGPSE